MQLLPAQRALARNLLKRLYDQADEAVAPRPAVGGRQAESPADPDDDTVTYNTYSIVGTRGAGKSTALKAIRRLLPYLGETTFSSRDSGRSDRERSRERNGRIDGDLLWTFLPEVAREIYAPEDPTESEKRQDLMGEASRIFSPHRSNGGPLLADFNAMKTALVLPIIDPSHFENEHHTVMEQVIAHLGHVVETELSKGQKAGGQTETAGKWFDPEVERPGEPNIDRRLRQCLSRLQGEISRGWVFAQSFGQKMLIDDSASFDEFVSSRAKKSIDAALRHRRWRELVDDVLDCFGARILVIAFDDFDLAPQHTLNVMDAIRVYLSSPRIAVILATDLQELRHNLCVTRFTTLAPAAEVAQMMPSYDAREFKVLSQMVTRESVQADLYLDKMAPFSDRLHLHLTSYFRGNGLLAGLDISLDDVVIPGDLALMRRDYGQVLSFLTARDAFNIRRLVRYGQRNVTLERLLAGCSALNEAASLKNGLQDIDTTLQVVIRKYDETYVLISVSDVAESADSFHLSGHWALREPNLLQPTNEPQCEPAAALRGTLLAFLIDKRLKARKSDGDFTVSVIWENNAKVDLAPAYERDFQMLEKNPSGLLSELNRFVRLPRNCRSLASLAHLMKSARSNWTSLEADLLIQTILFQPPSSSLRDLRPGKLPFIQLVRLAKDDDQYHQDITFRFWGANSAIEAGRITALTDPDLTRNIISGSDGPASERIVMIANELLRELDACRVALNNLSDAAAICASVMGTPWSRPTDLDMDNTLSFGGERYIVLWSKFIDNVIGSLTEATTEQEHVIDFLIATFGPLSTLSQMFGSPPIKGLSRAIERLFRKCMPGASASVIDTMLAKRIFSGASVETDSAALGRWGVLSADEVNAVAQFLVVPAPVLGCFLGKP